MAKRIWVGLSALLLLGCLVMVAPHAAPADEVKKEVKKELSPEDKEAAEAGEEARQIGLATDLAEQGRKEKAPEMLLTAARILRSVHTSPGKDEPRVEGGTAEKQKPASLVEASDKLLQEARDMAPDDKAIADLADRIAKIKARGALGGPRSYRHFPGDGVSLTWYVRFRVGVPASVTVRGDGINTLTTVVQGPGGYYFSWTGRNAHTSWVPGVPGVTTITVTNDGPSRADYTMYHN